MKTICIIQARLGGTRLPGKVMLPLGGKPMWQNVFERVSRATKIDDVVVAWPQDYDCDENDLVSRFLLCARKHKADWIIRVCADNPCVEAEEIDDLVQNAGVYGPWRLLMNSENMQWHHDGFGGELYRREMLQWMDDNIKMTSEFREHPHLFWIELKLADYCGAAYPPGFRLEVNTEAEYEKLKDIYDHFGHNHFSAEEALRYLEQKTHLEERAATS